MMAACLAKGITVIEEAAREPEIVDLGQFLTAMGAKIQGVGTARIRVEGVKRLHGTRYRIIPDRIEAGTYLLSGVMTGGEVTVRNVIPSHHEALLDRLREAEVTVLRGKDWLSISRPRKKMKAVQVTTLPYPGFPTDLQAQMMALMAVTPGTSVIREKIYPERFMHVAELNRMGSKITVDGSRAIVTGVKKLSGAHVMASDLRASAALVLAALVAQGRTEIYRVYHLDRGYERMEEKLASLGARVWREKE
jgi:UDP-N-acetylglucosamine 1-carboxyvinyltransferase